MKYYFYSYFQYCPKAVLLIDSSITMGSDISCIFKDLEALNARRGGGTPRKVLSWQEITAEEFNKLEDIL